jgi:hypothetical protein
MLLLACSDTNGPMPAATTADVDAAADAADATVRPDTIRLESTVTTFESGTPFQAELLASPIAGVEVCAEGETPRICTLTDDAGRFALDGLPPQAQVVLVYAKNGFVPALQPMVTPVRSARFDKGGVSMLTPAQWQQQKQVLRDALTAAGRAMIVSDSAAEPALLQAVGNIGNVPTMFDVSLDPAQADGPFYGVCSTSVSCDDAFHLDVPDAGYYTAFFVAEAREDGYELVFSDNCRFTPGPSSGFPARSGRPNASFVPARAGYVTALVAQQCHPQSVDAGTDAGTF